MHSVLQPADVKTKHDKCLHKELVSIFGKVGSDLSDVAEGIS